MLAVVGAAMDSWQASHLQYASAVCDRKYDVGKQSCHYGKFHGRSHCYCSYHLVCIPVYRKSKEADTRVDAIRNGQSGECFKKKPFTAGKKPF